MVRLRLALREGVALLVLLLTDLRAVVGVLLLVGVLATATLRGVEFGVPPPPEVFFLSLSMCSLMALALKAR